MQLTKEVKNVIELPHFPDHVLKLKLRPFVINGNKEPTLEDFSTVGMIFFFKICLIFQFQISNDSNLVSTDRLNFPNRIFWLIFDVDDPVGSVGGGITKPLRHPGQRMADKLVPNSVGSWQRRHRQTKNQSPEKLLCRSTKPFSGQKVWITTGIYKELWPLKNYYLSLT